MKKLLLALIIFLGISGVAFKAQASPCYVNGGCTGLTSLQNGFMVYGSSTNQSLNILATGTAGSILTMSGNVPAWLTTLNITTATTTSLYDTALVSCPNVQTTSAGLFQCNNTSYQTALTNPDTGTGANGYYAVWTGLTTLGQGIFIDNGTVGGINATSSLYTFNLQSNAGTTNPFNVASSSGTSIFDVTSGLQVGIGTTTPIGKLGIVTNTLTSVPDLSLNATSTQSADFVDMYNGSGTLVNKTATTGVLSLMGLQSLETIASYSTSTGMMSGGTCSTGQCTVSFQGSALGFLATFTTGSAVASGANVFTVNITPSLPFTPICVFSRGNNDLSAGLTNAYVTSTPSSITFATGAAALTAAGTYGINIVCIID